MSHVTGEKEKALDKFMLKKIKHSQESYKGYAEHFFAQKDEKIPGE